MALINRNKQSTKGSNKDQNGLMMTDQQGKKEKQDNIQTPELTYVTNPVSEYKFQVKHKLKDWTNLL